MNRTFLRLLSSLALGLVINTANATVIGAGGGSFVQSWGKDAGTPNTQTYGQTITVPTDNILTSFSFWLGRTSTNFPDPSDVSLSFMAYVYEWNDGASMATGSALYTSGVYTHNATPATPFTEYTLSTGSLSLATGSTYALFLSTSGLAGDGHVQWEAATSDEYPGGHFIFQNNGEDTGEWTSSPWGSGFASDLHFEANFTAATTVPEPSAIALLGLAFAGLGISLRRRLH